METRARLVAVGMAASDTKTPSEDTVINAVLEQVNQGHTTRANLYRLIEKRLGPNRRLVSFFTSFVFPVGIGDEDADMLEDVLRAALSQRDELVLMIATVGAVRCHEDPKHQVSAGTLRERSSPDAQERDDEQ